ncbi:hypothetical protein SAMN05421665_0564 [Yoonia rosea]|uniref:SNARE associated Golgi protein n=1 Tax=Yoonia rosea TaxID=287098 RepID=A0A1R3WH09_9RHOB|nr:hypothetical protein [Yoonia rosea]SIT77409.1 hypothetical protein SAMN05421665_0564 [Yoonia rosea]
MAESGATIGTTAKRCARAASKLLVVFVLVYLAKTGIDFLMAKIALFETDEAARMMTGLLITVMVGYAILLAIPFVPGVEIGIAILLLEGAQAAPFVYFATVCGLALAFCIGQYVPMARLVRWCEDFYLARIARLMQRIHETPRDDRLQAMQDRLPKWLAPIFCNYRYVTLGLAINLPGNVALGGGGGIMLAGGLSRLFETRHAMMTIIVATLPVPLSVWLLGTDVLQ